MIQLVQLFQLVPLFPLFLILLLLVLSYLVLREHNRSLPPGPLAWPIFGNIFSFAVAPSILGVFMKMRDKYGDVFTIHMGSRRAVVISGYENLREFYTKTGDDFLDRPFLYLQDKITMGSKGIAASNGLLWRETRRFTMMTMRDFGVGRQTLRDKVIEEATMLCSLLKETPQRVLDVKPFLTNSVSNVICSIAFGRRFAFDDEEFIRATQALNRFVSGGGARAIVNFMPWLRFLPAISSFTTEMDEIQQFVRRRVAEHRATFDSTHPRDFVDLYLQLENGQLEFNNAMFNEEHMYVNIIGLFAAGTETVASTLRWAILYMSLHEDIQQRCREQIHSLLGLDGIPQVELRQDMPLVDATILEVQRLGDVTPLGILRNSARDATFKGFRIPKDTIIVPLLHSAHCDPAFWPEPEAFRPERWLGEDGRVIHHQQLIPFSLGRRSCIGENLAKVELFTFFVMLLQRFSFSVPLGHPHPSLEGVVGVTRSPRPFQVLIQPIDQQCKST